MSITEEMLRGLFAQMQVASTGPSRLAPGQAAAVRMIAPPAGLTVTEMLSRTLSLEWAGKNVRFFSPDLLPEPLAASLKAPGEIVRQVVTLPIVRDVVARLSPGTAGGLGQLAAVLQTPVDKPVLPAFEWRWVVRDASGTTVQEGQSFLSPDGISSPDTSLLLAPPIRSTEDPDMAPAAYTVQGGVRITVGSLDTGWLDFPPLPFLVEPLRIPTVLALFVNENFQDRAGDAEGAVLIMTPAASPLHALGPVVDQVAAVGAAVRLLGPLLSLTPFGAAASALAAPLTGATHMRFASQDGIRFLNDWTLIQRGWFENDTEAEDEFSSLILVGAPGTTVRLHNARDYADSEGVLEVSTGPEGYVLLRDLDAPEPATEPPGRARTITASGWNTFRDTVSSVRFIL